MQYCKYPPTGSRGYGPMFAAHAFPGVPAAGYDAGADTELSVFVQIESRPGLESVEGIAGVEGLDGILVGRIQLQLQLLWV